MKLERKQWMIAGISALSVIVLAVVLMTRGGIGLHFGET